MTRRSSRFLALVVAVAVIIPALAATASAEARKIKAPIYRSKARVKLIRRGRNQRFRPQEKQRLATELKAMDVNSKDFQKKVSSAPLQVRMDVFNHFAKQQNENGTAPTTFTRRLRGMLKQHGKTRVAKPSKTFFEVTSANFDLFKKVMGKNVIWFAVNSSPGHLHTLVHDQNNGGKMHHNTYGEGSGTNDATITNNWTQYALPVVLTDAQMKRFTSYMNAGQQHHRHGDRQDHSVYGFFSRGQKVTNIACTNWVTSASIGELPRWAKTIDKRLVKLAAAGQINVPKAVAKKGLHAALVGAKTAEARQAVVTAVLGNQLTKWNKSAVKRMAKQFEREATAFTNKPRDLMMRDALAKTLGLGRSQDPAKWSYDLLMSKKVPVVAILNGSPKAKSDMELNMEIMGTVGANGWVKKSAGRYFGSNAPQNAGALGVVPDGRSTAVRPTATPAQ